MGAEVVGVGREKGVSKTIVEEVEGEGATEWEANSMGKVKLTVVPLPRTDATAISPCIRVTIVLHKLMPRPAPLAKEFLRGRSLSAIRANTGRRRTYS